MPRASPAYYDELLLSKVKLVVEQAIEKTKNKNMGMTFERFVKDWDVHDSRSRHLFSAIVVSLTPRQETAVRKPLPVQSSSSSTDPSPSTNRRRDHSPPHQSAATTTSYFPARNSRSVSEEWRTRRGLIQPPRPLISVDDLVRALNATETDERRRAFPLQATTWSQFLTSTRLQDAHVAISDRGTRSSQVQSRPRSANVTSESFADFTARRRRENRLDHHTPLRVSVAGRSDAGQADTQSEASTSTAILDASSSTSATTPAETVSCPRSPSPSAAPEQLADTCDQALTSAQIAEQAFRRRRRINPVPARTRPTTRLQEPSSTQDNTSSDSRTRNQQSALARAARRLALAPTVDFGAYDEHGYTSASSEDDDDDDIDDEEAYHDDLVFDHPHQLRHIPTIRFNNSIGAGQGDDDDPYQHTYRLWADGDGMIMDGADEGEEAYLEMLADARRDGEAMMADDGHSNDDEHHEGISLDLPAPSALLRAAQARMLADANEDGGSNRSTLQDGPNGAFLW